MALTPDVRRAIQSVRAPGMTAANPGQREPAAAPGPVEINRLEGILRTGWQVAAFEPDKGLQRPAVRMHRRLGDRLGGMADGQA